ncbi:MAG: hypothetical protein ACR2GH_15885 [Pseudonocardia sp.]
MSTYHLKARILVGPLSARERDEVRLHETDNWEYAQTWLRKQLADGFTAWIYDHGHVPRVHGASDYRVIAHERPATTSRPQQTLSPRPRRSSDTHQTPGRQAS